MQAVWSTSGKRRRDRVCDRPYLGRIVEIGARDALLRTPAHPYTQTLFAAVPSLERRQRRTSGNSAPPDAPPSPYAPPAGCHYHPRCPIAVARCRTEAPRLRNLAGTSHRAACHLA